VTYLLDTDTLSRFVRGEKPVLERLKATPPDQLAVSSVTLMKVEYGLALQPEKARKLRPVLQEFFESVELIPYGEREARATAALRAALKVQGTPIGAYDALIAGCALANGLILVTSNLREYRRVAGLLLEDWNEV
jgi:tRNA(fMet)-specific endonuclease VapC